MCNFTGLGFPCLYSMVRFIDKNLWMNGVKCGRKHFKNLKDVDTIGSSSGITPVCGLSVRDKDRLIIRNSCEKRSTLCQFVH